MRRRMIDPSFWNDSKVIALSLEARLLYIGLWSYADDEGFFLDDLPAIKRTLFPDQNFDIHGVFSECSCFLKRHQYKGDKGFAWEISHFRDWQTINRPTPSKIKPFCGLTEDSVNTHGVLTPKLSKEKLREVKSREVKNQKPATPEPAVDSKKSEPKKLDPAIKDAADKVYATNPAKFARLVVWIKEAQKSRFETAVIVAALERFLPYAGSVASWYPYLDKLIYKCEKDMNRDRHEAEHRQYQEEAQELSKTSIFSLVQGLADAKSK